MWVSCILHFARDKALLHTCKNGLISTNSGVFSGTIPKMTIFGIDLWNRCNYWVVAVDLFKYFGVGANIHRSCMVIQGNPEGWQGASSVHADGTFAPQCRYTHRGDFRIAETVPESMMVVSGYLGVVACICEALFSPVSDFMWQGGIVTH